MKRFLRPTRRQLLEVCAVVGALAFPAHGSLHAAAPASLDAATLRLLSLLRHRASARRIGRAYLDVMPCEANARSLVDLICGDVLPDRAELPWMEDEALRESLRRQLRRDFKRGCTVKVDGWILSATEARLCALAAVA
jgi:hypothetical protein